MLVPTSSQSIQQELINKDTIMCDIKVSYEKGQRKKTVLVTTPAHNQIDYDASEENVEYVTLDETL